MDPAITLTLTHEGWMAIGSTAKDNTGNLVVTVSSMDSLTTEFGFTDSPARALHKAGFSLTPIDDQGQLVRVATGLNSSLHTYERYLLHRKNSLNRLTGVLVTPTMLANLRERLLAGELDQMLGRPKPNMGKPMILPHPVHLIR